MLEIGARTGALPHPKQTVITKDFESDVVPLLAVTVPTKVPEVPIGGARWTLPVVWLVVVTVMNVGPAAFVKVRGSPLGSVPVRVWSLVEPGATVMFAGWTRTGGRLQPLHTKMLKDLLSLARPSLALTVAPYVPASEKPGARWILPEAEPGLPARFVSVMNVGPDVLDNVITSASASVAEIACSAVEPSSSDMFAIELSTGARLAATVIVKFLVSVRLFAVAVTEAANIPIAPNGGEILSDAVTDPVPHSGGSWLAKMGSEEDRQTTSPSGSLAWIGTVVVLPSVTS